MTLPTLMHRSSLGIALCDHSGVSLSFRENLSACLKALALSSDYDAESTYTTPTLLAYSVTHKFGELGDKSNLNGWDRKDIPLLTISDTKFAL